MRLNSCAALQNKRHSLLRACSAARRLYAAVWRGLPRAFHELANPSFSLFEKHSSDVFSRARHTTVLTLPGPFYNGFDLSQHSFQRFVKVCKGPSRFHTCPYALVLSIILLISEVQNILPTNRHNEFRCVLPKSGLILDSVWSDSGQRLV